MLRDMILRLFRSFLSIYFLASKPRTSPAMRVGSADTSKPAIARIPLRPDVSASQYVALSRPMGLTMPSPVITPRREDEAMSHLTDKQTQSSCGSARCRVLRRSLELLTGLIGEDFRESENPLELAGEHEILFAEELLRARLIEVRKEYLGFRYQLAVTGGPSVDCRTLGAHVKHFRVVNQLFSRQGFALKTSPWNLGQDHLLPEVINFSDQNAAGLSESLQNQRRRHDRIPWKMISKEILGKAQVLQRPRGFPPLKLQEPVDPDPAHPFSRVSRQ